MRQRCSPQLPSGTIIAAAIQLGTGNVNTFVGAFPLIGTP
jgi:hypothetical protein